MSSDVEAVLHRFVETAKAYSDAIRAGQSKKANRQVCLATDAYRKLREHGEPAQAALLGLLGSSDEAIRYMAAVHALDFAPEEGERVLVDITQGPPSPVRMLAQTSLSQWQSGLLRFDR